MSNNFSYILERLTARAQAALISAQRLSEKFKHNHTGSEHLLYGIVAEKNAFGGEILIKNNVRAENIKETIRSRNAESAVSIWQANISENFRLSLEKVAIVASRHNYAYIATEHLLFGLHDCENALGHKILTDFGQDAAKLKKELLAIFEHSAKFPDFLGIEEQMSLNSATRAKTLPEEKISKSPALDYFTTDLTERARSGKIDPVIGRAVEIERGMAILNRRHKNNPVLIGEPGVGKTAIVEGLALAIREKKVSRSLAGKRILALDLALMVAGSMFRGEFENRLKQVLEEIKDAGDVILFIDELHTLVGAGATAGSLDAANILKPALARGEIRAIGATTFGEYKKHIESDPALERRFQPIHVREPDHTETLEILKGLRPHYERHHEVKISDDALNEAVKLSVRYITDRFLPDKAIHLVDETAAYHKMLHDQKHPSPVRMNIEQDLAELGSKKKQAVLNRNFEQAAAIRSQEGLLMKYQDDLGKKKLPSTGTLEITGPHIAASVARITGIPVSTLLKKDRAQLINLEKKMKTKIVGQDAALAEIASAIRRSRAGISAAVRPFGSFMFLGPSGVGKTLLAKLLAKELFGSEKALVRIDMSELMERHNVARLIGAPAGYVGFEEGGRLTEIVRRRPYSVVLFDEIEKAHTDVFNLLLQILEEGHLTDAAGKTVNFRNTLIIMTSNLGLGAFNKAAAEFGFGQNQKAALDMRKATASVMDAVKSHFRTEFLNRI